MLDKQRQSIIVNGNIEKQKGTCRKKKNESTHHCIPFAIDEGFRLPQGPFSLFSQVFS